MATTPSAVTTLTTLTVKKGASTASLSLIRMGDGGVKFVDADGNTQILRDPVATKLFDAINALV